MSHHADLHSPAGVERNAEKEQTTQAISDLPPAELRAGDFSKVATTIYDPATRRIGPTGLVIADPLPGNIIPLNRQNPSSVAVESLLPLPNFGPGLPVTARNVNPDSLF